LENKVFKQQNVWKESFSVLVTASSCNRRSKYQLLISYVNVHPAGKLHIVIHVKYDLPC